MKRAMPSPLKKNMPLYQQAYQEIKKAILTGTISPGSKISENVLAEQMQISRTPLRDALRQLQKDGLLETDHVTTWVVSLSREDFEELSACRLILEKQVIRMAVDRLTEEQLAEIDEMINKSGEALSRGDYLNTLTYNTRFHEIIIQSCPNKRLMQLLEQVRSLLLLYRVNSIKLSKHSKEIVREHRSILEALKRKDAVKAENAIENHLTGDVVRGREILSLFEKEGWPE